MAGTLFLNASFKIYLFISKISEVLSEVRTNHSDILESLANEKELSKENDEKLKSILDGIVDKFSNS